MYLITKPQVNRAITEFVKKEVRDRGRKLYQTVPEEYKEFMEQFLNRFYRAFENLFKDKRFASEIFSKRLMEIDAIRFDDKDKDVYPLKLAFDEMEQTCKGELEGGLFMPMENHGVILLDMDFISLTKDEAIHTLIHEMVHAMSLIVVCEDGKTVFKSGVNRSGKTFNRLNEGITEYIAQMLWSEMYKNKKCPGVGRYDLEVKSAQMIMSLFESEEQFVKDYFSNGLILQAQMKDIKNYENLSLYNFIKSFDKRNIRSKETQKKFLQEFEKFKFVSVEEKTI